MKNEQKWVAFLAAMCLSPSGILADAPAYTIIELGRLPFYDHCDCIAFGMNNQGQVVGYCNVDYVARAVVWTDGVPQDIGAGRAWAISSSGTVVGDDASGYSSFIWDAVNGYRPLEFPGIPSTSIRSPDINDAGQIAGLLLDAEHGQWAYLFDGVSFKTVGPPGAITSSPANRDPMNASGHIAGSWLASDYSGGPFLYRDGAAIALPDFPGQEYTIVNAISDMDELVGSYWYPQPVFTERPIKYNPVNDQWTELPVPAGYENARAHRINDQGQIIGMTWTQGSPSKEVLWQPDGSLLFLNDLVSPALGWDLFEAWAIDNAGAICGVGRLQGSTRAFLLIPGNCPGDIVADALIDLRDLAAFLSAFGSCNGDANFEPLADMNGSGCVELDDLGQILAIFGTSCR